MSVIEKDYNNFNSLICLLIIILFAIIGRMIFIAFGGYKFPKFLNKFNL